jgi:hypothetical protein
VLMEKKEVRILVIVTVVVLLIIVAGNYEFLGEVVGGIGNVITGYASTSGSINLTVSNYTIINFTTSTINWGSGQVDGNASYAILDTAVGNVTDGNWTAVSNGFVVENIGNVDVIFNLSFGKTASSFLGGTSPEYKYNVTNLEASSCTAASGFTLGDWNEVSSGQIAICSNLSFNPSSDLIRIDFKLQIPSDSYINTRGDTMTATIEEI